MPGVTIGEFCIIGAGAVIEANIEAYSYVIGNPMNVQKIPSVLIKKLHEAIGR